MLKYSGPIMFTSFILGVFTGWLIVKQAQEIDNTGNPKLGEIHHHDKVAP
jgi:hypothetical protein